ncbi:ABC transporter ATP-binding protein [Muribaculaceae bacterium Isolate-039 (Harlan)]|jgi:ATP-binding cassette subfamily F protein 3|uniref:Probable ATP-binding protein YbiT n=4 Tax=Duncaniella muris TaxID=2094150 RepID=A0A2V1IU19_9BACT|nr:MULTISPECIES: ABC-F family ATP-binding cassette domain-containing protein [Duncaniella]ROS91672.1 ABC transporter ATP-binding protein [Muribaculaceae bacterium Isolate-039 (Harlan)]ROS97365.1 ABC transporter ATP-binding protein [Muribaculaceae bacterium Isolate-077 (Janvier)]ROS97641.1 ABC transporter ATP-binding protein [Muribaculaceae bacterium Isolate-083 (Janvier)]ROT01087.1 ABC transporter ATP-binding protein [Muribaculaceae bacterium Isolate-084 (Janvier)]PWB04469.1 ABC transporter AT
MSISINSLSVEFSAKSLFDNISYIINPKDRIALVGKNGAGKSTMLKIIAGLQKPTSGNVAMPRDTTVGYLPQHINVSDTSSVIDEVRSAFSHVDKMRARLDEINNELLTRTDYESDAYQELIETMTSLTDRLAIEESENFEAEIEKTLIGLGFLRSDFQRPTSEFSGGWRMRIELAKILLARPDVLLLDEPTNHLDIESIQWLENFLITKAKAVVLVSHDRAFIDNVTNRTIEISLGKIYDYSVNYSKYLVLRQERLDQQMRAYQNQQKMIQDTEDFIERFRYKATKSVQVQSRIKQLAKIERIEVDEVDTSRLNLKFPPAPRSGDYPVIADNVGKAYGNHQVFDHATFTIKRGEKVAFVGKNGEGKSTLVKCIMGEIPFTGNLKIGHNVKIGYFAQNQATLLDGEITVFDTIDRVAVGDIRTRIRDILGAFMFGGEASDKKVKVLSGGEKTRLAMIRLLLEPVNLLILDEPTNHLDMKTKDILKQAIKDFNGTVIVVSHDREFLDGLVEKVYEFGGGQVRECLGGIYEFLEKKKLASLAELERNTIRPVADKTPAASKPKEADTSSDAPASTAPAQRKLSYAEQREHEKLVRKARKKVEEAEAEISRLEQEVADIESAISAGNPPADIYDRHATATKQLENAMSLWELASMELEEISR